MSSSSRPRPAIAAALLLLLGCAPSARPPEPAAPPPQAPPSEPPRAPEPAPEPDAPPSEPEPGRAEAEPGRASSPRHEGRLDPSEEITPWELATIPDPVPGSSRRPDGPPRGTPPGGAESRPGGSGTPGGGSPAGAPREGPWSVQIFASEDRGEAQRVARTAAERLGVAARVDHEPPLYKVRLGRFPGEAEAQALRAQAVRAGYSGAFRVRAGTP